MCMYDLVAALYSQAFCAELLDMYHLGCWMPVGLLCYGGV